MLGTKQGNKMKTKMARSAAVATPADLCAAHLDNPKDDAFLSDMRMVAVANAELDRKKTPQELEHELRNIFPRGRYSTSRLIPTQFLHSRLFRYASNKSARELESVNFFPLTSGGYIECYGEELRQADESVLRELTYRMAGRGRAFELVFNPVEFVKALGWDNGHVVKSESGERAPYSVYRLKACIERLRGTSLRLFDKYNELRWSTGLVQEAFYLDQWKVQMSGTLLDMLVTSATAMNIRIRKQLHEGLETWLYGHLCANDCLRSFKIQTLRDASGSKASLPEFGRAAREALNRIKEVGGVLDFTPSRGKVFVFKKIKKGAKHTQILARNRPH